MPKKIVISEFMDEAAVDTLRDDFDVIYDPALVDKPDALQTALGDADAIIVRNRTQVRGKLLENVPNLKAVGRLGVGLDNIDLEDCKSRGISVHPASGANNLCVAEYVVNAAMTLLRGAYFGQARMIAGDWPRQEMSGREGADKVLGLVGFGAIARDTADLARASGFKIATFDPFVKAGDAALAGVTLYDTLDAMLPTVDVLSLHVPLTDATRNMIDADALAAMRTDAIVINAARGGVVDEAALALRLRDGQLGGAALDVFAQEPLTAEGGAKFAGLANLILTPHIAGVTQESNVRVSSLTAENVRKALS